MKLQTQFTVPKKEFKDLDYFKKVDFLEVTLKKECIDFAYSIGVLHHTPSPENGILEAFRVIKPGGELAVSVYSKKGYYTFPTVNLWRKFFQFSFFLIKKKNLKLNIKLQ